MVCARCYNFSLCDVAALHFFLLFSHGELVCAEGCTQVTGVMAMMMTGRVLLVCALCVLWCGASGGECTEALLPVAKTPADSKHGAGVAENPTGHTTPGDAGGLSAEQSQLDKVGVTPPGAPQLQTASDTESQLQQTRLAPKSTDSLTPPQALGEDLQEVSPADPPGEPKSIPSPQDMKNESIGNPERNDAPPSSNNNNNVSSTSEEPTEDTSRSAEIVDVAPSKEGQEGENVTNSLEQSQGNSAAAPATTTHTISMTSPGNSVSSTVNMTEAVPQPTGTAQTNHTAKPGDSDSSTAVSHTTSPLLLLLVAFAAAAAVAA
ncbi:mucin-associated surface protein (MASP), putative [Trypanosoma cruzi marinkellei]|uniref:Mucin-associated surface protein (MASP), putative n=1 Tax=Trypanosoma cruzi marinkellei TaxID=85056 RepID=K2MWT8_TRYCR|nr:mucin-associated surface protein (MASP), putative [Trypanosoma cruzi marinkellei]